MKAVRTLILLTVAVLTGAAAGYFGHPYLQEYGFPQLGGETHETRPPLKTGGDRSVTALGRLEPESQIVQVSAQPGSRIERLPETVKDGATVVKGEPLAYLDTYPELLAAKNLAESQLGEARARLKAETACGEAAVGVAKLKIQHADEVMPRQIEAEEAEVRRSQAELNKSKLDLTRSADMLKDRAISASQHDSAALMVRQCEELLARNKATLEHLKLDRDIKLLMAKADLNSAVAGQKRGELSAQVQSLASAVQAAQARLERSIIRAPISGQIIKILTRAGETVGRDPILKMGNTNSMYALAEVYETDIRLIRTRQKAIVTSRAFPNEKLTGIVDRIGSLVYRNDVMAIDPSKDADSRVIEVRIRLDDSKVAAKFNYLQVDVTIEVGSH